MTGRRAGAVALIAVAGMLWLPAPARAADTEAGWWYRYTGQSAGASSAPPGEVGAAQAPPTLPPGPVPPPTIPIGDPPGVPAPVPPPATVPEGGLYVANDLAGPTAVGAVRFASGPVGEAILRLTFAESPGVGTGAIGIVACPILAGFQAVANGAFVDRPAHDCSRIAVTGTLDSSNTTMSWTLPAGFQPPGSTILEVVLQPATADGTVYSVTFQPPVADDLIRIGAAPPPPSRPPATVFRPDPTAPAGAFGDAVAEAARPAGGSSSGPVSPSSGAVPGAPPAPGAATGSARPTAPTAPVAELFEERPWVRLAASVILLAMAAAIAMSSRSGHPATVGGTRPGGIGRFNRERLGTTPAVS